MQMTANATRIQMATKVSVNVNPRAGCEESIDEESSEEDRVLVIMFLES